MTGVIARFGVLGVFVLMVPESACIPIPSEVTLLFSGFAVRQGWMSFPAAVLAATAGNLVGAMIAYALGASRILERVPGARGVLRRSEVVLERHGARGVLIARLLPLARTFVSLPAGARRVPLPGFVAMTAAGSAMWRRPSSQPGCWQGPPGPRSARSLAACCSASAWRPWRSRCCDGRERHGMGVCRSRSPARLGARNSRKRLTPCSRGAHDGAPRCLREADHGPARRRFDANQEAAPRSDDRRRCL